MVFVGDKDPDFDSFEWCKHFTKTHYNQFAQRKKKQRRMPHEPIGFFQSAGSSAHVKLEPPVRGKYIIVKIGTVGGTASFDIERIEFDCIHGLHPLGHLIGSPEADTKRDELLKELRTGIEDIGDEKTDVGKAGWSLELDETIIILAQTVARRIGVKAVSLDSVMLNPTPDELVRYKKLDGVPLNLIQGRFAVLKYLNRLVTPLLHYIDVSLFSDEDASESGLSSTLSGQVHRLKGCYFMSTKKSVFDTLLASSTSKQASKLKIIINRIKASRAKDAGSDPNGEKSIFGQVFSQLRSHKYSDFARCAKGTQLWNCSFAGEGSIDVGGPYRESISSSISDLQSDACPLFILCPNGKNSVGLNREKWIVNPSSASSLHLAMYEFVGVLIGIALRTKHTMGFDMPSIFWKSLLAHKVDIADLEAIDKLCVQVLDKLEKVDDAQFQYICDRVFTAQLSNGQEVS